MPSSSILGTVSLNVPKSINNPLLARFEKPILKSTYDKDEDRSMSTRSSQTELSDIVNINGTATKANTTQKSSSVFESQSLVALFVGDLDKNVTEDLLFKTFSRFTSLVSVKVCHDAITKTSLGYGYLNFSNKDDAEKATEEFNYRPLLTKEIRIMPSLRNPAHRKNIGTNVFFANLPLENPKLTTRYFYESFKKYGKILSCKLDSRKNIGFIYFEDNQVAKTIIKLFNNKVFMGNKILCGIHFDKELREFPAFEKNKSKVNLPIFVKEQLENSEIVDLKQNNNLRGQFKNTSTNNAIFVRNLPIDAGKDEILDFFSTIGPVKSVYPSKNQKYNSLWAFITYKKSSDVKKAIEAYNNEIFHEKIINVVEAERGSSSCSSSVLKTNTPKNDGMRNGQKIVYLGNLNAVCNEEFLSQLCFQEKIKFNTLKIDSFKKDPLTFAGYVECQSNTDATRLYDFISNRLIGSSVVNASWEKSNKYSPIVNMCTNEPKLKIVSSIPTMTIARSPPPLQQAPPQSYYNAVPNTNLGFDPSLDIHSLGSRVGSTYIFPYQRSISKRDVIEKLKRQVKKGIDFLKYPTATRDQNLICVSNYILEVYWQSNVNALWNFLSAAYSNTQNESLLHKQIEEAAEFLGFGR